MVAGQHGTAEEEARAGLAREEDVRTERESVTVSEERVVREDVSPAGTREAHVEREAVVTRETVAGPEAADDDISAPAVVDGEEVETNEQTERKGKKKRGFLSRFFDL